MSDGDPLLLHIDTYRIPSSTLVHQPAGESVPTAAAFALSSAEREAQKRGGSVRVSVWDASKITATRAKAQRTGGGTYLVFRLPVYMVDKIASGPPPHPALRVVEDRAGAPVEAPAEVQEAHAGIEGLDQSPPGVQLKAIRAKLAEACSLVPDETHVVPVTSPATVTVLEAPAATELSAGTTAEPPVQAVTADDARQTGPHSGDS